MISRVRGLSSYSPACEHHFFGVKTDSFIHAGIVILAPDRIRIAPGQRQLEEMSRHAFVHARGARVIGICFAKIREVGGGRLDPARSILIEARGAGEIIQFAESIEGRNIIGRKTQGPMRQIGEERSGSRARPDSGEWMRHRAPCARSLPARSWPSSIRVRRDRAGVRKSPSPVRGRNPGAPWSTTARGV